ncbi:hypothetical protein GYMLUDRAFT_44793 [Collybiopsis luxurians FD-317 M1]|uniref:F-box domain-containing protein n=1 Tax=Collybiopsis luxurians FD-317 M1 TaxID=944289 RepID=A0A0D0CKS8_9AGAR|nr:hypothetical protein GYMLUDRAFT_44793 [Collybiopsis luxurians FD-317 M1]
MGDPLLPQELVEAILDNLLSDKATLRNCALVGKAWLSYSQRGLFQHIELPPLMEFYDVRRPASLALRFSSSYPYRSLKNITLKAIQRLDETFNNNPQLLSYVQSLEIQGDINIDTASVKIQRLLHASMSNMIRRLSSTGHLVGLTLRRINWSMLFPSLKDALISAFRAPSITEICLAASTFPSFHTVTSLLALAKGLRVLTIDKVVYAFAFELNMDDILNVPSTQGTDLGEPRSIHLKELRLDGAHPFGTWLERESSCPFRVDRLEHLRIVRTIHYTPYDRQATAFLLQNGGNLRNLELQDLGPGDYTTPEDCIVHLGHAQNLCNIKLILMECAGYGIVDWILSLFESPDSTANSDASRISIESNSTRRHPLLRQVTFEVAVWELGVDNMFDYGGWDRWNAVDELFAGPQASESFPSLDMVTVLWRLDSDLQGSEHLSDDDSDDTLRSDFEDFILEKFSLLAQAGKIEMEVVY